LKGIFSFAPNEKGRFLEKVSGWRAGGDTQIPATTLDVCYVHVVCVSVGVCMCVCVCVCVCVYVLTCE